MNISVVIPARNEGMNIERCIKSILDGSEKPFEIIVADGDSKDHTAEIACSLGATVIRNPEIHAAGGRNAGIAVSSGDVIAFIDADCIADTNWLREIKHTFETEKIDGLGTYIEPAPYENKYEKFWGELSLKIIMNYGTEPYYVQNKTLNDAFITASCAYTRELLDRLGGFNVWFANNAEDIDLCWRALDAGAVLKYEPKAKIQAHSPTTRNGIRKKSFRNGVSSSKLQKIYGGRLNYDLTIYKQLFRSLIGIFSRHENAGLLFMELVWHLFGKYYGSIRYGVINI